MTSVSFTASAVGRAAVANAPRRAAARAPVASFAPASGSAKSSSRVALRSRRGASVVVRAEDVNPLLDRENPELEEKFATIGSGEHECKGCLYTYVPSKGDPDYPVAAGTQFKDLPEDWRCPTCGADKTKFKNLGKQVAGFAQNQGYGLGTNSMTGGEKSLLIYGALALFFALFLGGYLLE
ncbi:uncharacterized protein MICPUCDRAFT_30901 [Micromonas pusilla CCMP1545]|uniref:Predicted protein n=2 Tax=Micromonas pusilla TaxID=38833 RepID=C1MHS6_MICPC|nr:uncharacterized protein MICPUCDRAFT_30901 [Micromonas pusilla CCMP1545]EEH60796.1 predicted protein [Micromonas pusilla CCMP1545]|eukprot:XP_003055544.1 predicted protein [Micromonas pusilla CCMP1545]